MYHDGLLDSFVACLGPWNGRHDSVANIVWASWTSLSLMSGTWIF